MGEAVCVLVLRLLRQRRGVVDLDGFAAATGRAGLRKCDYQTVSVG